MRINLRISVALMLSASLIAGILLVAGCTGGGAETPLQETPAEAQPPILEEADQIHDQILAQDAYTLMQENQDNPDFVIIDVRSEEEFAEGHIAGAVNIDYYSETFADEIDALDRDKTYLVYYSCNCERVTAKTMVAMAELNFRKVYYIDGGMDDWIEEGLPTAR